MIRPGSWLGLPAGVPDPLYDLGYWRDLLTLVAAAAAWLHGRDRGRSGFAAAVVFGVFAIGFWVLALGRPYGVLVDPALTRWAADVSVLAEAGGADGFLAGEPGLGAPWTTLAALGTPRALLLLSGTLTPLLLVPALALGAAGLASPARAWIAATLFMAAGPGSLDALRGLGLVDGAWRRPLASAFLLAAVGLVLLASRLLPARAALGLAVVAVVVAGALGADGARLGLPDSVPLLTLDQWPWALAALLGARHVGPGAAGLLAGGGLAVLASPLLGGGAWIGHGAYRLGLLVAAAEGLGVLAEGLAAAAGRGVPRVATAPRVLAVLAFAALAGGFLVWRDPFRMDPVARASAEPFAPALEDAMAWVRANTAPQGTFVASAEFAPAVAILGGRRVLRSPGLAVAPDDERRLRAERAILAGRDVPDLVRRYGLGYVLAAPGDFARHGIQDPIELEGRGGMRLLYLNARGIRIYEIPRPGASGAVK
jgi:hypothetical protein